MIKTIYQRLKPNLKKTLDESARSYDSAKRLKYKLMSSSLYHELTINDISSLMTYADVYTSEVEPGEILYGTKFLNK